VNDGIDRLAGIVAARVPRPVHADEVAVLLEATGFTDRTAVHGYRQPGLFALAAQVRRRLGPPPRPASVSRWDRSALGGWRLHVARLLSAAGFGLVAWRWGLLTVLPALVAVPLGEVLVGWYGGEARWAAGRYDNTRVVARHRSAVGRRAVLALVPPLLVATAVLSAARQLHSGPALRAGIGVLLAGAYPLVLLLAAGRRLAASVAALLAVAGPWGAIGGYLAGLVVAAEGLSTGPYGHRPRLPRVLSRAVRRADRLEKPPRDLPRSSSASNRTRMSRL